MNIAGMNRGGGSEGALIMPKLPTVPQSENNYLGSDDGGRPSWKKMPDPTPPTDLTEILSRLTALETRLDGASIDAQCQDGTVTVTLNL